MPSPRCCSNVPRVLVALAFVSAIAACHHPSVSSTAVGPPTQNLVAQFWVEPEANRDLYCGVGGCELAPDPNAVYTIIATKEGGYSEGFTVRDQAGREWSAKLPPEAHTEVVASRLLWGVGYHQPPIYFLNKWRALDSPDPNPQRGARFRQKDPNFHGLKAGEPWSYYENPFVGTPQMNGLLVLHVMLGSNDLKDANNGLYTLEEPYEGANRWFVARDLGQTFGRPRLLGSTRGNIDEFEATGFIEGVKDGKVRFDWAGRHPKLIENIAPADVLWICQRLNQLTDQQWHDAFRAGGFHGQVADRFIHHLKQKIAAGLQLAS